MARFIRYDLKRFNEKEFTDTLKRIEQAGFSGVVIPAAREISEQSRDNETSEFHPLEKITKIAKQIGLKITFDFNIFESKFLWSHKNFSAPVNYNDTPYYPGHNINYFPICPNNPLAEVRVNQIIGKIKALSNSTTILLSELSFPFDWKLNSLDIQDSQPPFCYCPFCLGEFSEYIEEAITAPDQIQDNIRFWMDWRIEVIYDYFQDIYAVLADRDLIISIPPLSLIDIPFVTGQIPIAYLKDKARISPPLLHRSKRRKFHWVVDQLRHYDLEMREDDLVPIFEVNPDDIGKIQELEQKGFRDVIYYNWDNYRRLHYKN